MGISSVEVRPTNKGFVVLLKKKVKGGTTILSRREWAGALTDPKNQAEVELWLDEERGVAVSP